ncbi:hypothetical protein N658DRAFT_152967 [Parathielavia hyrcaniae]|uniref:Uncharacterized protein n=1 Tax=Parathielavia hyrcaniae TaxID=113614 RepID=A0AAN6T0H1_9PEZI|nr:hypothetical protein N658DRAFT_152967 [Parathielavia hyrcaniae]
MCSPFTFYHLREVTRRQRTSWLTSSLLLAVLAARPRIRCCTCLNSGHLRVTETMSACDKDAKWLLVRNPPRVFLSRQLTCWRDGNVASGIHPTGRQPQLQHHSMPSPSLNSNQHLPRSPNLRHPFIPRTLERETHRGHADVLRQASQQEPSHDPDCW